MRERQNGKDPMSGIEVKGFDSAANFMRQIVEGEFDAFGVAGGAGGVNEQGGVVSCSLRFGGKSPRGRRKASAPDNPAAVQAPWPSPVRLVSEDNTAACVFRDQTDRAFRKRRRQWHGDGADSHRAQQNEYPLRNVFHQNADAVSALHAPGNELEGYAIRVFEHIRISVFLDFVLLIDGKRSLIGRTFRPFLDLLKDQAGRTKRRIHGGGWAGNFGQEPHNPLRSRGCQRNENSVGAVSRRGRRRRHFLTRCRYVALRLKPAPTAWIRPRITRCGQIVRETTARHPRSRIGRCESTPTSVFP